MMMKRSLLLGVALALPGLPGPAYAKMSGGSAAVLRDVALCAGNRTVLGNAVLHHAACEPANGSYTGGGVRLEAAARSLPESPDGPAAGLQNDIRGLKAALEHLGSGFKV